MAKITLQSLISGLASISKLNANFTAIANEFQNKVLYRDNPAGEANQMECDLDLNQNNIDNVSTLSVGSLTLAGSPVVYEDLAVLASEEEYTPEMAGAVGDGTTDDTTALQSAINTCLATGRILQLGNAQYVASALSVVISGVDRGPLIIRGHGAPSAFTGVFGSQIIQKTGTTGSLFTVTGDFAEDDYLSGVTFEDLGLKTAAACTGWAIDARNMINNANTIKRVTISTPGTSCAGAIRMNSCWSTSIEDVTMTGPAAGSTSRGLVMYGSNRASDSATRGTSNQIVLKNVRANYYAICNVQIGKWDSADNASPDSTGGFMHGIVWIGGQAGNSSAGYGVVFARVFDVRVIGVHTEGNYKSGWYFDDNPSGNDCADITLLGCDSYGDGDDGVFVDAADRYGIQVNRGRQIKIDGFRFQMTKYGVYVADSSDVDQVHLDRINFTAHTNGGITAIKLGATTASTSKRTYIGSRWFSGTWTNKIVNGEVASRDTKVIAAPAVTASTTDLTIAPMQTQAIVANAASQDIEDIVSEDGDTLPEGYVLTVVFSNGNSTLKDVAQAGNFKLENGRDFTPLTGDSVTFCKVGTEWWETSRKYRDKTAHSTKTHTTGTTVEVTNLTDFVTLDPSGALTITDFTGATGKGPVEGQVVRVYFADTNSTLEDNANNASAKFYLQHNRNFKGNTQDSMTLQYSGGYWAEASRMYNGTASVHSTVTHTSGGTVTVTNLTEYIVFNLGASTDITDLVGSTGRTPRTGQVITLTNSAGGGFNPTLKDISGGGGATFVLESDADLTLAYSDTAQVAYDGTNWRRVGGSNN